MNDSKFPTWLRVAFVVQLIFGVSLLSFSSAQFRMGQFSVAALFCIFIPPLLVFASVGGLKGQRWALTPSLVAHTLLCLASARFCFPELFYIVRGVDRGWAGPIFLMISAPILLISLVLAISIYHYRANSQSTGNA